MIGDILSSRSADTLSLLRQNQTSPAKADTDSLQLVDLHAVQEVDSGFEGTPISYSPRTDDAIALTLLACFFLSSIALARGKKFLSQQVKDFVLHRERTSIFDSSTAADVRYLLVLVLQTCVLSGITFLNYFQVLLPFGLLVLHFLVMFLYLLQLVQLTNALYHLLLVLQNLYSLHLFHLFALLLFF